MREKSILRPVPASSEARNDELARSGTTARMTAAGFASRLALGAD